MQFVEVPVEFICHDIGVSATKLNQVRGWIWPMAGDRGGRINHGPRKTQSVRFPVEHFAYYSSQAAALGISLSEYIAYRLALVEGLRIPDQVLLASPALLNMLSEQDQSEALRSIPRLADRYKLVLGVDPDQLLPNTAASMEGDALAA